MQFARRKSAEARRGAGPLDSGPQRASDVAVSSSPGRALRGTAPLRSLLWLGITWRVLAWWTAFYGLSSWFLEYAFSQLDRASATPSGSA
jgi:hypothetical protein